MDTDGILDVILEKTSNTEQLANANNVKESLNDTLRSMAKREKLLRDSTIMVKLDKGLNPTKVSDFIENNYCNVVNKPSATYWQDREFAFVQFISQTEKESFLDWANMSEVAAEFKTCIQAPNDDGEHIQRKPVRIVINNVRRMIKAELVEANIKRVLEDDNALINFHEGKANSITGTRSIMFNTNSDGFRKLFGVLEGTIPYVNSATGTKTRLFLKINCKPWTCRDCYAFGVHQCEGKVCANCGQTGHLTKDCKCKTKFCKNCKRKGHKSKEPHCPMYLAEIAKELRKICIPIDYFVDEELRFNMLKHIQIS